MILDPVEILAAEFRTSCQEKIFLTNASKRGTTAVKIGSNECLINSFLAERNGLILELFPHEHQYSCSYGLSSGIASHVHLTSASRHERYVSCQTSISFLLSNVWIYIISKEECCISRLLPA